MRDGSLASDAPANGIHPHTRVRDGSLAYAFSLVFTPYLWTAVVSGKSPHYINLLVVHNPLVSLIGRLVACSARTHADRRTDRTTTVTLAAHARRGLTPSSSIWGLNRAAEATAEADADTERATANPSNGTGTAPFYDDAWSNRRSVSKTINTSLQHSKQLFY